MFVYLTKCLDIYQVHKYFIFNKLFNSYVELKILKVLSSLQQLSQKNLNYYHLQNEPKQLMILAEDVLEAKYWQLLIFVYTIN